MRIENQSAQNVAENVRSSAARATGSEPAPGHQSLPSTDSDQVSLSSASSLLQLAKSLPSHKQQKIQALASQVQNGTYRTDGAATSHSLVTAHLGR